MFSGTYPFSEITSDFVVMFEVTQGKRPSLPSHDLSRVRGLNDQIARIIESCWSASPSDRLSASQIVEEFRALPGRPSDQRPVDSFNSSFSFQVAHNHPFSVLLTSAPST